jgi:hypothetical protein
VGQGCRGARGRTGSRGFDGVDSLARRTDPRNAGRGTAGAYGGGAPAPGWWSCRSRRPPPAPRGRSLSRGVGQLHRPGVVQAHGRRRTRLEGHVERVRRHHVAVGGLGADGRPQARSGLLLLSDRRSRHRPAVRRGSLIRGRRPSGIVPAATCSARALLIPGIGPTWSDSSSSSFRGCRTRSALRPGCWRATWRPESAVPQHVAWACMCLSDWAADRGARETALVLSEAAALSWPPRTVRLGGRLPVSGSAPARPRRALVSPGVPGGGLDGRLGSAGAKSPGSGGGGEYVRRPNLDRARCASRAVGALHRWRRRFERKPLRSRGAGEARPGRSRWLEPAFGALAKQSNPLPVLR